MLSETDYLFSVLQQIRGMAPAEALGVLQAAADAHPGDPRPMLLMAGELASAQQYDQAEGAYIATLQRAPDFAIARFQLGLLQFTSARPGAAMATWAPLDQLPEGHYLRLFKQAFGHLAQDQFDDALRLFREGIAHNAENAPLNQDMERLIQRILQSGLGTEGQAAAQAEGAPEAPAAEADTHHFLLSAYRQPN